MIYQGLFNILSLYLDNLEFLYTSLDQYFQEKIINALNSDLKNNKNLNEALKELKNSVSIELKAIGIDEIELENKFNDPFLELVPEDNEKINTADDLYKSKVAPIIYEIFLEELVHYLADATSSEIILTLKSRDFLNFEFIVDIKRLKSLFDENESKKEKLRKYIEIGETFIKKLSENKRKIEILEDLNNPKEKLQLLYLIHRIINFFHLERIFDFSHITDYIKNNVNEWLMSIPLVTLKNPDLYYCGLYLAKNLKIPLDKDKIRKFLMELYEEGIDEFEAPLVEATDGLYYFLKSTNLMNIWLDDSQIDRLIETDATFFEPNYLKNLETSQLVIILKIYTLVNKSMAMEHNMTKIMAEIEKRITSEGITQYREGFVSSEASYYVLFCRYMNRSLEKLKEYDLLSTIVSRIYRNLELLEFTADMNYDLISELFYSFESLKLYNCIETKEMIIRLAKYLFPSKVVEKIESSDEIVKADAKFRHLKVNRITGDTEY
ncbi:MAG: hypothetical protein EU532_11795 [Promethearchaeota archaeon]|nr:MAG: hypothetical protein EU532_11795 [Candidatus Lokiarchaeota archaeon]